MKICEIIVKVEEEKLTIEQACTALAKEKHITLSTKDKQNLIHNVVMAMC